MTDTLRKITAELKDGEGNPVLYDHGYLIRGQELSRSMEAIARLHGSKIRLLPLSAMSAGDGILGIETTGQKPVIALQLEPSAEPKVDQRGPVDISELSLDEIIIDRQQQLIHAGAGITLGQLNQALEQTLGPGHKVLGADLTSYSYAQVGATFMTGGMGPQRRYFSHSVESICLYDGAHTITLSGSQMDHYAGTYGWTGLVTALSCRYVRLPGEEFGFAIPVHGGAKELGSFLQHFARYCFFDTENLPGTETAVLGLEHVTLDAMGPMLAQQQDTAVSRQGNLLSEKCHTQGVGDVIFVNGYSTRPLDELLFSLVDDVEAENPTISGMDLENTLVFDDPVEMRVLREAIPYAARTQSPNGKYVYKNHTDLTIRLDQGQTASGMENMWLKNQHYVESLSTYFASHPNVGGQVLVYGHLNPYGVDPHNRVTLASDIESDFKQAVEFVTQARSRFYRSMVTVCSNHGAQYIGGEKGAGSEAEIIHAFDNLEAVPVNLRAKFLKQTEGIAKAPECFNWRALKPYR